MQQGAGQGGDRGMRIGATLMLLFMLYVGAYGLLRATGVLIRIGPGYTLSSAAPSRAARYVPGFIAVSRRHDHLGLLAPVYAPLGRLEILARGLFDSPRPVP